MPAGSEGPIVPAAATRHVAAVAAMAAAAAPLTSLGSVCSDCDLGVVLIRPLGSVAEVETVHAGLVADTTLGTDLGVAGVSTDEVYAAMDWLAERQDTIEKQLVANTFPRTLTRPGWRCSH